MIDSTKYTKYVCQHRVFDLASPRNDDIGLSWNNSISQNQHYGTMRAAKDGSWPSPLEKSWR